ncbi:class I adenylate-forming enzyme family protein [Alcaligenes endophyticus]|uniref:AMP-binding protein n=1 Tax=Alcaligenes endophyticus TaxID=1929088 RepID=A0ABT8EFY6_9BURK|nr:AMP-binding protein [Alcaligenes endophyticus]MCX5590229.1 AMP-binding protein [Alcaligenes endophyticus]MDN4120107.1 AMP-binding protein [Alcaligenes endophyticus]
MITNYLYEHATKQGDKVFLVYGDTEFSYAQMAQLVSTLALQLQAKGVTAGSRVALLCSNRPAFLISWFAINELGAVCVPLNVSLVGDSLRYILGQSEAKTLLIEPSLQQLRLNDLQQLSTDIVTVLINDSMETSCGTTTPSGRVGGHSTDLLAANSILYTSGTTGLPKGAVLPHQAYVSAGHDMVKSLQLTRQDRILVFLPLFHANPQMYAVSSTLVSGATMILLPRFSASQFFNEARHYEATGFTYVGTVLSILEKHHPTAEHNHGLRWCVGGGAPARVWNEVSERYGINVNELYGMTETGGWVTMNTQEHTRVGSVGRERPNIRICIRDEHGTPVAMGQKGEITAYSKKKGVFFSEYWNNPESTATTLKDGWLYTGDRGYLDEDGYLYFDGRIKELIRRGGEMIAPTEIEQQLLKHPAVLDCAVIGVDDEIMGEEVKAVVVVNTPVPPQELRSFLAERIAAFMLPRYFSFIDAIPKTETQKVKRYELSALQTEVIDTVDPR